MVFPVLKNGGNFYTPGHDKVTGSGWRSKLKLPSDFKKDDAIPGAAC